ncbi:MAG TPA: precorrin-3B C(17)-methyltransferase [Victivallales bacterium]|nr:precorrin-3B C(17)-methyltransferase [Victivallales bacterium]
MNEKTVYAVGIGPGAEDLLSPRAKEILLRCDVIVGYDKYLDQFSELLKGKILIPGKMRQEKDRCTSALDASLEGKSVAVISSGDAGIYAMAGLLMELSEIDKYKDINIEVIPGITAASAASAVLGAPLMNDFAIISLSDLMTPQSVILKRIIGVANAGLVCVLYNPSSKKRNKLIHEVICIFKNAYDIDIWCGIVRHASREKECKSVCKISEFPFDKIDMSTVVVLGNDKTVYKNGQLYTLRGYGDKNVQ